ncbi:MAG: amino acid racemase [Kiritimatiellae bacterium]|nr:amino acid racemase [Kiritimatiellia bacterium]MCO5067879.1 amino acid racemase [Kiritimatiellia bacterium]
MKKIGLIGGLTPESTAHYYLAICREHNAKAGGLNFPEISLESVNLQQLIGLFGANEWEKVAEHLLRVLHRLKASGADFAAILANTPHNAYDRIRDASPLKIVTIMEATSAPLLRDGRRKVALLGTKATMEYGFFQKHFESLGISSLIPPADQRQALDRMVWDELAHGVVEEKSRAAAKQMIAELERQGAEAVILACTELSMLIKPEDTPLPLYDTMILHAEAILAYAQQAD